MFEKLKGNDLTKSLLRRLSFEERIPQALLLSGRDGIGKKQFALELARSFVCLSKIEGLPCGTCAPCLRSSNFVLPTSGKKEDYLRVFFGQHPDVGLVVPNKNSIYIDAIRNLAEEANYRPYEAKARVFIIDEAEKLGLTQKGAANALLKTLEEPAPTTYIILVTSKPSAILQTIHSRCQTIRFAPVADAEIEAYLAESTEVPSADRALLARIAKGSIADAVSIDSEEYKTRRGRLLDAIESATNRRRMSEAFFVSEEMAGQKEPDGYERSLDILEALVRDMSLIKRDLAPQITNIDLASPLAEFAGKLPVERLAFWIEEIESLKRSLRININKKIGADALFVKMAGV